METESRQVIVTSMIKFPVPFNSLPLLIIGKTLCFAKALYLEWLDDKPQQVYVHGIVSGYI